MEILTVIVFNVGLFALGMVAGYSLAKILLWKEGTNNEKN